MTTLSRTLLTLLILAAAAISADAGSGKGEKLFIVINYSVYHCNAEIELNGITMTRTDKKSAFTTTGFSTGAGLWIWPGKNTITVRIKPIENKDDSSSRPSLEVSLSTVKEGQMTNEGINFFTLKIPEKEGDTRLDSARTPFTITKTFTPAYVPPSLLWEKAKTTNLDAAARKEITGLVKDYHTALLKKNTEAVWSILQFSSADSMRIRHQPADDMKKQFTQMFGEMMADKNFVLLPFEPDKLVMKPVAEGKIIQVTDQSGREPIRTKETKDAGAYTFGVYVGKIDGKWMIVR